MTGHAKGRQDGEQKEASKILLRLLTRRFGQLPDWASAKVSIADTVLLETWSDHILDARILEDVFAPPNAVSEKTATH